VLKIKIDFPFLINLMSTADTTDIVHVNRRLGDQCMDISTPMVMANYNKIMGGVDCHDRLHSTFSLCKCHGFKKYYDKLVLFLVNIALTNAWVYFKMFNEESCRKEGARVRFFEELAERTVNGKTNWQEYERSKSNNTVLDQCNNTTSNQQEWTGKTLCIPVHLSQSVAYKAIIKN